MKLFPSLLSVVASLSGASVVTLGFAGQVSANSQVAKANFNLDKPHKAGELIVKFKPSKTFSAKSAFQAAKLGLMSELGVSSVREFSSSGAVVLSFKQVELMSTSNVKKATDELEKIAKKIAARSDVAYVEANSILSINKIPNDARFGELYGLHNTGLLGGVAGADIKATEAWEKSTGSKKVLVGVIDTGVDYNHPDLKRNIWRNKGETGLDANGKDKSTNGIDDDENGYIDDHRGWDFANNDNDPFDDNQHGTHVSGTIGARGNDGMGVVGVNWRVSLVGLKFLAGDGSGSLESAVRAIEYGTKIGVTLTSNSWGGGGYSQTMFDAIAAARDAGILFVAAAGNDSNNNDRRASYPASYKLENIISVAATDNQDKLATFSNYGATSVHVGAPGVKILSTTPGGQYKAFDGTSMACPHVAGAAALLKAIYPKENWKTIRSRLVYNTDGVSALSGKTWSNGRLNVSKASELDVTPPSAVQNVAQIGQDLSSVTLEMGLALDDNNAPPAATNTMAATYEVRVSDSEIVFEEDWLAATTPVFTLAQVAATETMPARISATISGMPLNSRKFVAIRAVDNVGLLGDISQAVQVTTKPVSVLSENIADEIDSVKSSGTWGVETMAGRTYFSDSVGGNYKDGANNELVTKPMSVLKGGVQAEALRWEVKYSLESKYDFGYVTFSQDGGKTFEPLANYTGTSDWKAEMVDLRGKLKADTKTILVKFAVKADGSETMDGLMVDNIQLLKAD